MEENKNILHVVDMSGSIYAGSFNRRSFIPGEVVNTADGYRERQIPTGGTSMLFNILGQYMGTGTIAFAADRNPTIKKEIYPEYKGNRKHPTNVSIEKEVAEFILQDCGFTIYAQEGYEADDIIYSIVKANQARYDHIYVHTGDSDLYLLVNDKVSILPNSSKAKTVTMENYESVVSSKGAMPYNAVVFNKILRGDPGKNLRSVSTEDGYKLLHEFCTPQLLPLLGATSTVTNLMKKSHPELVDFVTLYYPLRIEGTWDIPQEGNPERIKMWAYEIGNRKVPGVQGDLSAQIKELMDRALYIE